MNDTFVIEMLKACFKMEISNKVVFGNNEIIIYLADGTKAKITA